MSGDDLVALTEVVESQTKLGHKMTLVPTDVLVRLIATLAAKPEPVCNCGGWIGHADDCPLVLAAVIADDEALAAKPEPGLECEHRRSTPCVDRNGSCVTHLSPWPARLSDEGPEG